MINFFRGISLAYAITLNPVLTGLHQAESLVETTTIKQIIENKMCDVVQIKLSPKPKTDNSTEDTLTLICPPNHITKKNTFLNLEFKNNKLININVVIPLNEDSISNLIESNSDWIKKSTTSTLQRDDKKTTMFNSPISSIIYLKSKNIVCTKISFKDLDILILNLLTKKILPFTEKNRHLFFQEDANNVVWQWFDLKSSTKGFVTYNNDKHLKLAIISIETKIFNQDNFL